MGWRPIADLDGRRTRAALYSDRVAGVTCRTDIDALCRVPRGSSDIDRGRVGGTAGMADVDGTVLSVVAQCDRTGTGCLQGYRPRAGSLQRQVLIRTTRTPGGRRCAGDGQRCLSE